MPAPEFEVLVSNENGRGAAISRKTSPSRVVSLSTPRFVCSPSKVASFFSFLATVRDSCLLKVTQGPSLDPWCNITSKSVCWKGWNAVQNHPWGPGGISDATSMSGRVAEGFSRSCTNNVLYFNIQRAHWNIVYINVLVVEGFSRGCGVPLESVLKPRKSFPLDQPCPLGLGDAVLWHQHHRCRHHYYHHNHHHHHQYHYHPHRHHRTPEKLSIRRSVRADFETLPKRIPRGGKVLEFSTLK